MGLLYRLVKDPNWPRRSGRNKGSQVLNDGCKAGVDFLKGNNLRIVRRRLHRAKEFTLRIGSEVGRPLRCEGVDLPERTDFGVARQGIRALWEPREGHGGLVLELPRVQSKNSSASHGGIFTVLRLHEFGDGDIVVLRYPEIAM